MLFMLTSTLAEGVYALSYFPLTKRRMRLDFPAFAAPTTAMRRGGGRGGREAAAVRERAKRALCTCSDDVPPAGGEAGATFRLASECIAAGTAAAAVAAAAVRLLAVNSACEKSTTWFLFAVVDAVAASVSELCRLFTAEDTVNVAIAVPASASAAAAFICSCSGGRLTKEEVKGCTLCMLAVGSRNEDCGDCDCGRCMNDAVPSPSLGEARGAAAKECEGV